MLAIDDQKSCCQNYVDKIAKKIKPGSAPPGPTSPSSPAAKVLMMTVMTMMKMMIRMMMMMMMMMIMTTKRKQDEGGVYNLGGLQNFL